MTDKKPKRLARRLVESGPRYLFQFTAILIGVLVALSWNSYGERQQEKRLERFYIQELISNLTADEEHLAQVIEKLYLRCVGRRPTAQEMDRLTNEVKQAGEGQEKPVLEDLFWALLNSKEFAFNH